MPLAPGLKLGPYEILSPLGAGGMGEVYKARDARLSRTVAIKVLPSRFSQNAEMKARFEREAKTIGGLNHPNICVLHDIGHQDGTDFLVMEYLEGQTLAARLEKGAMPLHEALKIAAEIADALDKAHREGVVHRDLKPSNVMLTKSGTKLLDFGLAKLSQGTEPVPTISSLPTNADVTEKGTILGTVQYMSPEQLEGQEADTRSDIFAFGVTLYEMLSGQKAFSGKTTTSTMAAILKEQPPSIRENFAGGSTIQIQALDRLINRCLAKNPEERWQSVSDLRFELGWIAETTDSPVVSDSARYSTRPWIRAVAAAIGVAVIGFIVLSVVRLQQSEAPRGVSYLLMTLEPAQALAANATFWPTVAIDPTGRRVAFAASRDNGVGELYVRPLDQQVATVFSGTSRMSGAAFSPDGQWIAFLADGTLKKVPAGGGPVQNICPATGQLGVTWVSNDMIVFGSGPTTNLLRVAASGGTPEPLFNKNSNESVRWAVAIPGTSSVLFAAHLSTSPSWDDGNIDVVSLDGTSRRTVLHGGVPIQVIPSGVLFFRRGSNVFAVSFDLKRAEITGTPVQILDNLDYWDLSGASNIAISSDATIVYEPLVGTVASNRSLVWLDQTRAAKALIIQSKAFEDPRVSPDGQRLLFESTTEGDDIWVLDLRRDAMTRLTFDPGEDESPVWSPDGKWVAYSGSRTNTGAPRNLFRKPADGSGTEENLFGNPDHMHVDDWSRDGNTLLFEIQANATQTDIWALPMDGKGKAQALLSTKFNERNARLSPDGHWIAYTSNESGSDEVYVQAYPSLSGKWQVSTHGGDQAVWSHNGKTLYYRGNKQVMAVDVPAGATLQLSTPRALFDDVYETKGLNHVGYDIAPDGRFIFVRDNEGTALVKNLSIIENFLPELKKRLK